MNKHLFYGSIIITISIALAIIMMCLEGWFGTCDPTESPSTDKPCVHVGLRRFTIDYVGGSISDQLDSEAGRAYLSERGASRLFDAGTRLLAPGVIGIFFFVVSTVVLCIAHRKLMANYRIGAMAGLYVASALLILGAVLYAYKLFTGYSFMLMTISAFFYFIGVGLLIAGGWEISELAPREVPDTH